MGAILDENLHLHGGIKTAEHLLGYLHACKHALFLDEQFRLAHGIFRDAAERGVVAIADILSKGKVNQPVVQFFYR